MNHAGQFDHRAEADGISDQYGGSFDDTVFLLSETDMHLGSAFPDGVFELIGHTRFEKGYHIIFLNSSGIPVIIIKQFRFQP